MSNKVGRRSRYYTKVEPVLDRIPAWRKQGLTEKQVAEKCGVSYSSINNYKRDFPELMEALATGKEELIEVLEDSLYKKAMGFEYEETETFIEQQNGKEVKRVKKVVKQALPDTGALCFALKNLAPHRWRDRKDYDVEFEDTSDYSPLAEALLKTVDDVWQEGD